MPSERSRRGRRDRSGRERDRREREAIVVDDDVSDDDDEDMQVPHSVMLCEALSMLRADMWLGLRVVALLAALYVLLRRPDIPAPPPPPTPPAPPAPPQPAPPLPPCPPHRPPLPIPPPSVPAPFPPPPPPWWYPPPPSPSPSGPPDPPPPPQRGTTVLYGDHGLPPPPPPHLPVIDDGEVLAGLNERFAAGLGPSQRLRPGTTLSTLGVLLRLFDRTEDRLAPWRGCPAPPFTPAQLDSIRNAPG